MANEKKHIAHIKSGQTVTNNNGVTEPKLPTAQDLILGELAVNYAAGYECISLKNSAGNIVPFVSKAYVNSKAGECGTVTSVSITVPTGLSVTGSPITTNGTLAIALENGYVIPQQTTLNSFLKGTVEVVSVTADNNSYNAGTIAEGTQKHVIFNNEGNADYIVTIPTTYHTPDGQTIELTVPNGGYAEANFMNINGTIYVRGI